MILVYLDVKEKVIRVYGESERRKIPFKEVASLEKLLGDRKVMYVTNARITNAKAVMSVVRSTTNRKGVNIDLSPVPKVREVEDELVIRATSKASLTLKDVKLIFKGPWDFYPVQVVKKNYGEDVLENSSLKRFVDSKHLEVAPKSVAVKNAEKWQAQLDKRESDLASIVTGSHDEVPEGPGRDPISIDLEPNSRGSFRKGGGGGGSSSIAVNEGSLLPEDF